MEYFPLNISSRCIAFLMRFPQHALMVALEVLIYLKRYKMLLEGKERNAEVTSLTFGST